MGKYEASLEKLRLYIESESFKGYDPYDTLTSPFPFRRLGLWSAAIATQIQKRNPINIRPLLGIRKDYNPKAMGLLLYAYVLLQESNPDKDYSETIRFLFNWLCDNQSPGLSGPCWGYNFGWANPEKYLPPYAPTVVATAFVAKGLYEYYRWSGDAKAKEILIRIPDFILKDLPVTATKDGICYSYTPVMKDCCYNASLLGAETLARVYQITGDETLKMNAGKAVDFVIAHQHADGRWNYKIDPESGKERQQIDFHQGYVIDSISAVMKYCELQHVRWQEAIGKGLEFYRTQQFFPEGRSWWRLPVEYPVEIHNQAQGIITFIRHAGLDPVYPVFARTVADWTIHHMQDPSGYFYYRKLKYYTNKISFMRWSNAWMLVALVELEAFEKKKKS